MSSNKYVPPALRNREVVRNEKKIVQTEENFPSLSARLPIVNNKWKSSFAALATEWNEHEEEEKVNRQLREDKDRRETQRRLAEERNVVTLRRRTSLHQEEYDTSPSTYINDATNEDDWTVIDRKKLKPELSLEEKVERDQKREEEERKAQESSVWDNANPDDWDYRDRRAVA